MHFPALSLCSQCSYGTMSRPSEIASNFKTANADFWPLHPAEHTEQRAAAISQWLPEARRGLAEYNKELNRLQSFLVELERVRDEFQRCVDYNISIISPVRRLPFEVLTEIFSLSCAQNAEDCSAAGAQRTASLIYPAGRTALRLSLVCSRWRRIALHTPEMWSVINVSVYNHYDLKSLLSMADNEDCVDYFGPLVELYLKRSSAHPLAITVNCDFDIHHSTPGLSPHETLCDGLLSKVFFILTKESCRWRTALINLAHGPEPRRPHVNGLYEPKSDDDDNSSDDDDTSTDFGSTVFNDDEQLSIRPSDILPLRIPLLEVLDIYCGSVTMTFAEATRLHTLAITATKRLVTDFLLYPPLVSPPCLRSLTLRKFEVSELEIAFEMLRAGPGLVDVHLEDLRLEDCVEYIRRVPAIKTLSVSPDKRGVRSVENLFQFLRAEHVTSLEFQNRLIQEDDFKSSTWWFRRVFPYEDVIRMVMRSKMNLRVLKIDGFAMWNGRLIDLLVCLPTLEVLNVAESMISSAKAKVEEVDLEDEVTEDEDKDTDESSSIPLDDGAVKIVNGKFLRKLTIHSATSPAPLTPVPLLPALNSLSLTFRPNSLQKLLKMIRSRWSPESIGSTAEFGMNSEYRPQRTLKSVAVTLILDPLAASVSLKAYRDGLSELRNEGLDVVHKVIVYEKDPVVSRVCEMLQG